MYAALWRLLPGPRWLKVVQALALPTLALTLLFTLVFPWLETVFVQDPTLG
jgi:hypothetical protein